jgi:thioredoxin-like negative regulator of GroEL
MVVKILYLLSTLLIIASAYKQTKTDVTVKLTPANFDKEVMRSKDIWFIMFSTKDCKHCTKVKGKFKLAASKMDGLVKFGEIDLSNESNGPLGRRFDIKGIPTINIFEYGLKNKRKSKTYEYTAKKEWKTLVTYATNLYE